MLTIEVPIGPEGFDDEKGVFVPRPTFTLELEHSLVSLSKWESFWEKPFLGTEEKTIEQTMWYIKAMAISPNVPENIFELLDQSNYDAINAYINSKQTATWFREEPNKPKSKEIITSELIYHWIIALNINWEVQNWHLNRLLTLIRVCNEKNQPEDAKRKRSGLSKQEMLQQRRDLNAQRKRELKTKG